MFNIAICDDDEKITEKIYKQVEQAMLKNGYDFIIKKLFDGRELLDYCSKNLTDITIVDVDMPKMNGFDAVQELQKNQPDLPVIFVTAHNEYAFQAYDYHPYHFVRKLELEKLDYVLIELVRKLIRRKQSKEAIHICLDEIIDINVNEIMYFKSSRNYILAYSIYGESTKYRGNISLLYKQLYENGFIYTHRSYVVNCRFIWDFTSKKIILRNREEIPVTRDKQIRQEAQKIYAKFKRDLRW